MKRKKLVLSIVTAAALSGFGAAHAQTEVTANPNVGADANVGISNTDINAGASASQSSSDIGTSSTMDQSASTTQSTTSSDVTSGMPSDSSASASAGATGSEEDRHPHGKARGHDPDRAKGLDRADEVAGIHGQHGRDNAREKQDRN